MHLLQDSNGDLNIGFKELSNIVTVDQLENLPTIPEQFPESNAFCDLTDVWATVRVKEESVADV